MEKLEEILKEIERINERNKKVEANKAWETSWTRKLLILMATYFVICLTLIVIKNTEPFINAIIPCLGFFLSTLTIPIVKNIWIDNIYKRRSSR